MGVFGGGEGGFVDVGVVVVGNWLRCGVTGCVQAVFGGIHVSPRNSICSASSALTPCFLAVEM